MTEDSAPAGSPRFAPTRWSLVAAAGAEGTPAARAALEALCATYWYPLYAFVRRRGEDPDRARDAVQGFFLELLEKDYLRQADPARGRFRTFLLAAFRHHVSKERERDRALKRGGGREPLPLDFGEGERRFSREPQDDQTPERIYERRWALALLDEAMRRLAEEHRAEGRRDLFEALRSSLGPAAGRDEPWADVGARLGMSAGAVRVAAHRLRRRYRDVLRAAIEETVRDPADVDDEIRHLLEALAS